MVVGVLKIEIYMESTRSLKEKRSFTRSFISKIKSKFTNISVSEVDSLDLCKKVTLGVSFAGNENSFVNSVLDKILNYIEHTNPNKILKSEIEIINF